MRNSKRDLIPTSYEQAAAMLGNRASKGVCNNTRLVRRSERPNSCAFATLEKVGGQNLIGLELHDTIVIAWSDDGRVCLDHGESKTITTKDRMNRALRGTGFCIFQRNFDWVVLMPGGGRAQLHAKGSVLQTKRGAR